MRAVIRSKKIIRFIGKNGVEIWKGFMRDISLDILDSKLIIRNKALNQEAVIYVEDNSRPICVNKKIYNDNIIDMINIDFRSHGCFNFININDIFWWLDTNSRN